MAGGGGKSEEGNVNIIPLLDVIFIFIFFLLMSVQFLEYFQLSVANPVQQTPPDEPIPDQDKDKSKQYKLRLSNEKIEFTEGMDELVIGSYTYDDSGLLALRKILLEKKMQFPDEKSMIIKPYKDVDFVKIVRAIDAAQQKIDPTKKNSEKAFRGIAFESWTEEGE